MTSVEKTWQDVTLVDASTLPDAKPKVGLTILFDGSEARYNKGNEVDIIAVHGIGADPDRTWIRDRTNWLKDADMLPRVVPRARILRFAYESQWLGQEAIQQRLPLVADQLLHSLMSHRASCLKRPLILIGHCFGGLVIEKALLSAKLHQTNFPGIFDSIAGVVFLGTPHRGSSSQSKASLIATIASSVGYGEQSSLLKAVEQDSEVLTDLVYDFASTANATSIPLFCFFEQHKSDVAKLLKPKASLAWPTYKDLIVDERSGTIDGHPKLGLACDHFQINRFSNAEDANYRYVSDQLVQLVRAAPNRIARRAQASTNLQSHVDVQDQRDQACLQAIFITDPVDDMRTIESKKDRVMNNSSNWMTQDPAYEEWQRPNSEALLWLHGEPGKGKTMLAISLVSEISQRLHTEGNQAVLAYFFCDNKDDRRRTTTAVLRGLIYQILMQRPELCFYLRTQYEKQKEHLLNSPNTLQTLWRILRDIASDPSLNELYIVIDALDECDSESTEAFLALLVPEFIDDDTYKETDRTTGSNASVLKLLLTSRNEIAIRQQLAGALEISLEQNASHVNSAVQGFVDLKVKQLKKQKKYDDKLTAFVQERLLEKAEGTFLWAALACKELSKPAVRLMQTRTVLLKLPSGIMPLYDRILSQISNLEDAESRLHAEAILRVMVTVTRPLSLQEAALLADLPDDYHGEEEILEDYVDGLCGSMVEIRKGSVHFVHLSARDYLLSTKTVVSPDLSLEHEKIAVQCFRHLCADDAGNGASEWLTRRTSTHYNRLEYPTLFWLYHLKQASKSVAQEIRWDDPFFQPHSRLRAEWFNVYWERAHAEWEERPTDFAAIHLAAYADIDWLASALLEACPESAMNLTDSQSNTPLAWAAKMGSERVAAALVSSGADVAIKNKDGITALYLAAAHGYRAMVQMLAENGASVKVRDRLRWTPLHRAADLGNTEVVLCLLNNSADIEAKDGGTWTALYRAVSSGQLAVMKILLDHNANADIPDREGMTLLHTAAWNGHKEIVLFLLSYAKDIDTRDREGWSAVHHAAWNGHGKVVDVLLLNKADANAKNNEGNTPLYNAAWNGHSPVIRSLVQNGARVNELCTGDETALQQAAYRGQTSAAQTLLDLGADPNARNALGATALHHAATNGQKAIVRLLLDAGADPLAKSKDGQTAYEAAKENSYYELARYIESRGGRVSEDDDSESGEDGMMERRTGLPVDPAITEMLQLSSEISTMQDHGDACSTDPFKITTTVGKGKRYYFVKIGPLEDMFKAEHASLQALFATVPSICPLSYGFGKLRQSEGYFLATDFLDVNDNKTDEVGSGLSFAKKLADLHKAPAPIPEGFQQPMFGFGLATYAGRTRQENAYRHSWAKFYADNRLRTISRLIEEAHGTDEELRTWIEKTAGIVVPKLLGNGHLGGRRGIVPSLVHGDLWSGNKARGRLAGSGGVEDVAFDASCCYAHSEFELGLMRMFGGFSAGFFSEYHRLVPKTEPQSEYEDRMKLYQVYHWLNNWIIFRGGYRDDGMDCMQDLWKKYGGDQEEEEVNEQNLTSD